MNSHPGAIEQVFINRVNNAVRHRIFDPVFTTAGGRGGTGLGMTISFKRVTATLGGSVAVASETGRGTRFIVRLPRVAPDGSAAHLQRGNAFTTCSPCP